jgi:hypothetical protein
MFDLFYLKAVVGYRLPVAGWLIWQQPVFADNR